MSVRINLTKKGKIGILAIVMLVLAGSGGYLLWRVNQENTVSPTDSEAGGNGNYGGCNCTNGYICDSTCPSSGIKDCYCKDASGKRTGSACGTSVCGTSKRCQCNSGWKTFLNPEASKTCTQLCGDDTGSTVTKCSCGADTGGCGTNCKFPSGTSCQSKANSTGKTYIAMCNVGDGSVSCEEYNSNQKCWGKTAQCNNPVFTPKTTTPTTNTCDSGSWITKPSSNYEHCATISYAAVGIDSDGIKLSSISVLLNETSRTDYKVDSNSTSATISGELGSASACLASGSYTLKMNWSDSKDNTSANCSLSTTFTIQSEQTNPDWSMSKGVVEKCIDENTQNPTSELTYTITIKNVGTAEGSISKIVDTLDTKVKSSYIGDISNSGAYASGKITWTLSSTDKVFAINQQKVFTYTITLPKDAFGKYQNVVTAYPTTGDTLTANANITANCTEAPQTGIFDTTLSKIALGLLLIVVGITFNRVSTGFIHIYTWGKKAKISMNEMRETRRIKKFEKRVVKR